MCPTDQHIPHTTSLCDVRVEVICGRPKDYESPSIGTQSSTVEAPVDFAFLEAVSLAAVCSSTGRTAHGSSADGREGSCRCDECDKRPEASHVLLKKKVEKRREKEGGKWKEVGCLLAG